MTPNELDNFFDVPRSLWDPTEGTGPRHGERTVGSIRTLEVHWAGTGSFLDEGDSISELLAFENYHEKTKSWYDLFYNGGLDGAGTTYEGRDATIPSQSDLKSVFTLLVVAAEKDKPTTEQQLLIARRIYELWKLISPPLDPAALRTHNERPASTTCAGPWLDDIVDRLRKGWDPSFDWETIRELVEAQPPLTGTVGAPLTSYEHEYLEAVERGITDGTRRHEPATREEVAVMVHRATS